MRNFITLNETVGIGYNFGYDYFGTGLNHNMNYFVFGASINISKATKE